MSKRIRNAGILAVLVTAAVCISIIALTARRSPAQTGAVTPEKKDVELAAGQAGDAETAAGQAENASAVSGQAETAGTTADQAGDSSKTADEAPDDSAEAFSSATLQPLIVDEDPQMYTYDQMTRDLQTMQTSLPQWVMLDSLADTPDGRKLWHMVIGDAGKAERHLLVTASIHAREYMTSQLVMKQAAEFLKNIENYPEITAGKTAVHLVPMINPDGVSISQLGLEGCLLEETRARVTEIAGLDGAKDMASYLRRWKSNSQGVDLNRNFDALWETYNDGLGHPSADHYKGTAVGCTPEAAALISLTEAYPFARTISYHTQGNVIYWYFGQTGDLKTDTENFARQVSAVTGYPMDANYEKLDPAGYKDWAISKKGIPSLTIEVGTETSPVPPAQFQTVFNANRGVWDVLLQP